MADDYVYRGALKPEAAAAGLLQDIERRLEIDRAIAQFEKQCTVHMKSRSMFQCVGPFGYAVINRKNAKLYSAIDRKVLLAEADLVRHQVAVLLGLVWAVKGPDSVSFG